MHEVRVTVPEGDGRRVAQVALDAGIKQVAVQKIYVHGPNHEMEVVSAETSTPCAKAFIDGLLSAPWFDPARYSLTARELRAILTHEPLADLTRPMVEPAMDVLEDLWQLSHITPSYLGRACSAAILLAHGMFENSPISIVVAALFLPFLSQVLAVSFGLWMGDRKLARQGIAALGVSTAVCITAGVIVALLNDGPLAFSDFKRPLVSFGISCLIGLAAGLSSADDAGRRYLIGVAAAVQYSVFPVWFGICLVRGFPDASLTGQRIGTFALNVATIATMAVAAYAWTGMRRKEVRRFRSQFKAE
jgi:hypothetical protein